MSTLDAMARYAEIRSEHGLRRHDNRDSRDIELLDFFIAGVCAGTSNALLKIKEHAESETHAGSR